MRIHMWVQAVPQEIRPAQGYGVCGVHIGQFTSRVHEISCEDCLQIIKENEGNSGPKAAG